MPMGQKTGSLKNLKQSLSKGGGDAWIKYIPKNGARNVRFIEEPEEWVSYYEHWDDMLRKSYPCNEETTCPGCSTGDKRKARYIANAIDLDDKNRVIPLQLPKDLANRLVVKYEKWGSITDREIELTRSGDGLDTVYDLDAGPKDPINLGQFQTLDLLKTLQDAYDSVFGDGDKDAEDVKKAAKKPVTKPRGRSTAAKRAAAAEQPEVDDDADEDEEEEPEEKPAPKKRATKKAAAPAPKFEPEPDEDEEEEPEESEEETEDEDEEDWTEEALRALPLGALRTVARAEFEVDTKGLSPNQIIEAIFEAGEVEEGDPNDPPF